MKLLVMINLYTWLDNYPDNKKISQEELNKQKKYFGVIIKWKILNKDWLKNEKN